MLLNDLKKALYKQNPEAKFIKILKKVCYYNCELEFYNEKTKQEEMEIIIFSIPIDDMGDASFNDKMEAKLLIRWISEF